MIRSDRFVMSHKPFAVNLNSYRKAKLIEQPGRFIVHARIDAVWYRRKDGQTRACLGTLGLWSQHLREPVDVSDPIAVLSADLDSRYGGDCFGRWDGVGYWGSEVPAVMEQHLAILRPMLDEVPSSPAGYDGWWRF